MPVTKELINQVTGYESEGYGPDEIIGAIKQSSNPAYKDVVAQIDHFTGLGNDPADILDALKNSPSLKRPQSWGEAASTALGNVPGSSLEFLKNITAPIHSPVETVKGLANLVQNPGQLADYFGQRYGGVENIRNTFAQDPVGIAADVGGLMTGGGALMAKVPMLAKAGQLLNATGRVVEPLGALKAATKVPYKAIAAIGPDWLQRRIDKLYSSAAKGMLESGLEDKIANIRTAIREEIKPNPSGYYKLRSLVNSLNDDASSIITEAAKSGATVDATAALAKLDELKNFYSNAIDAPKHLKVIDDMRNTFLTVHGQTIPIDKAQAIKRTTYKLINDSYGELSSVEKESQKAVARGLKDEIATMYPELSLINQRESALLNLQDSIEKAAGRIMNYNLIGMQKPITTVAGGAMGGSPGAIAGLLAAVLDVPAVKAKLAFALYRAKEAKLSADSTKWYMSPLRAGARMPAYQAGKLGEVGNAED